MVMSKKFRFKEELEKDQRDEFDLNFEAKTLTDSKAEGAFLCEAKKRNPNDFSVIYANKNFYEIFRINAFNLVGKNYDFLFAGDLDHDIDNQMEYARLIKAAKDFHECSIVIFIPGRYLQILKEDEDKTRFKINFIPIEKTKDSSCHRAIITFERVGVESEVVKDLKAKKSNISLLRTLERSLRNERILREVANLMISDLPIDKVAQNVAKVLRDYLRVDRCLIHDYREGITSFITEHNDVDSKPMFSDANGADNVKKLKQYINFQNHFYEKFGSKTKKSSLLVIDDMIGNSNFSSISEICREFKIVSQIAVTIIFNGKVNGGIYIHQADKRSWLEDEIELIEIIADQFSIVLDRSDSIERVMVANHALIEKTAQLKNALKHEQEMRKIQNEFVTLVSHEFKTPLQIIDSTRELLVRKIKNHNFADDAIDKALERIKSGIQRMNGLIHSTLNLAKIESGEDAIKIQPAIFNLNKFVHEIIATNSSLAQSKEIRILSKIDELPKEFNGDQKLLEHSITNIISNAIKYSRSNSAVKIMAKTNDKKIALRVVDRGIGIPKEDLSNIGKKFFRARNTLAVAGSGIGLYLTKYFIELHNGELIIESEFNAGTSITIVLPRN